MRVNVAFEDTAFSSSENDLIEFMTQMKILIDMGTTKELLIDIAKNQHININHVILAKKNHLSEKEIRELLINTLSEEAIFMKEAKLEFENKIKEIENEVEVKKTNLWEQHFSSDRHSDNGENYTSEIVILTTMRMNALYEHTGFTSGEEDFSEIMAQMTILKDMDTSKELLNDIAKDKHININHVILAKKNQLSEKEIRELLIDTRSEEAFIEAIIRHHDYKEIYYGLKEDIDYHVNKFTKEHKTHSNSHKVSDKINCYKENYSDYIIELAKNRGDLDDNIYLMDQLTIIQNFGVSDILIELVANSKKIDPINIIIMQMQGFSEESIIILSEKLHNEQINEEQFISEIINYKNRLPEQHTGFEVEPQTNTTTEQLRNAISAMPQTESSLDPMVKEVQITMPTSAKLAPTCLFA